MLKPTQLNFSGQRIKALPLIDRLLFWPYQTIERATINYGATDHPDPLDFYLKYSFWHYKYVFDLKVLCCSDQI